MLRDESVKAGDKRDCRECDGEANTEANCEGRDGTLKSSTKSVKYIWLTLSGLRMFTLGSRSTAAATGPEQIS